MWGCARHSFLLSSMEGLLFPKTTKRSARRRGPPVWLARWTYQLLRKG